ncbi:hypothetical protein QYF36_003229 [Acer negundo]|nr:hypothetical protein QYF36_003229 [Acer negundo]
MSSPTMGRGKLAFSPSTVQVLWEGWNRDNDTRPRLGPNMKALMSSSDFAEYDEKGECPIMISNLRSKFDVVRALIFGLFERSERMSWLLRVRLGFEIFHSRAALFAVFLNPMADVVIFSSQPVSDRSEERKESRPTSGLVLKELALKELKKPVVDP